MKDTILIMRQNIEKTWDKFEKAFIENAQSERYGKHKNGLIFSGDMFGVDINLKSENGKSHLHITNHDHVIWLFNRDAAAETALSEDISTLAVEDIVKLWQELQEFIAQRINEKPFAVLYQPKVEVFLNVEIDGHEYGEYKQFIVFSPDKQQQTNALYREFWLSGAYLTCHIHYSYHAFKEAYNYLFDELFEEFGFEWTKEKCEQMLVRYNSAIAERKRTGEDLGWVLSDRDKMIRAMCEYTFNYFYYYDKYDNPKRIADRYPATPQQRDLLRYMALNQFRYDEFEYAEGLEILKRLAKEGDLLSKQYLKSGSGTVYLQDAVWKSDLAECSCNDVFWTVTFKIKEETEAAYLYMLDYLLKLVDTEFPEHYKIKFNSKLKNYLPVKDLHKSGTHKFWMNCAAYENLHPVIASYIIKTMDCTEKYCDGEPDEEGEVAVGGYAMLALLFKTQQYDTLFETFLQKNEHIDHNVFPQECIEVWLSKWGVTPQNLGTVLKCMCWYSDLDESRKAEFSGFKNIKVLKELNRRSPDLDHHTIKDIINYAWKSQDGLQKAIATAVGEEKEQLQHLLYRLSKDNVILSKKNN